MRLIADLLIKHTSDQHPWFQEARRDRSSPYHECYVWSDEKPSNSGDGVAFPGEEKALLAYFDSGEGDEPTMLFNFTAMQET